MLVFLGTCLPVGPEPPRVNAMSVPPTSPMMNKEEKGVRPRIPAHQFLPTGRAQGCPGVFLCGGCRRNPDGQRPAESPVPRFWWIFRGHCPVSWAAQLSVPARLPEASVLSYRRPAVLTGRSLHASEDPAKGTADVGYAVK